MSDEASSSSATRPSALWSDMLRPDSSELTRTVAGLKRRASSSFEGMQDESSRKRLKEKSVSEPSGSGTGDSEIVDGEALAKDLEQELQCACCSALVYRPVAVIPCMHFFCGSCIVMWIRNGGTNCPACRSVASVATPSRIIEKMVDVLLRSVPSKVRPVNERIQADEIYVAGGTIRIPSPRQPSPDPPLPHRNTNFVHPCPHCTPDNHYGWRCPRPIIDPEADPDRAWHADDGSPPGHAYCGNCENVLALEAPSTTKCDFCQVSFCGIGIPGRCVAAPILQQHLHGLADLGDLVQCSQIYDSFDGNTVEVDIMLDYLTAQRINPRFIYREIIMHIHSQSGQFAPLFELDLFADVHAVSAGPEPGLDTPRNKVCRVCAAEIFLWGVRDWWVRERRKGFLEEEVTRRLDCPEGRMCARQKDYAHAKEFNHVVCPPGEAATPSTSANGASSSRLAAPGDNAALPPLLNPEPATPLEAALFSHLAAEFPDLSQDFRDEVEALL